MYYFDWAATAKPDESILKAALETSLKKFANPSSTHLAGGEAHSLLEDSRKRIAKVLKVEPSQLYFTSGATESNQLVLSSLIARPARGSVLISAIEHPSVLAMANNLKQAGFSIKTIPCNNAGFVTADAVKKCLTADTQLVAVMAVNNEMGAIEPIAEIAKILKEGTRPIHFHCDMVQALCKVPIDLSCVDSASFSAHKIGGARGAGLLYLKKQINMFLAGGGQENGIRSGTENIFGILTLANCIEKYRVDNQATKKDENTENTEITAKVKMSHLISGVQAAGATIIPQTRVQQNEQDEENFSPYILQITNKKFPGEVLVRVLSEQGFLVSAGSACSSHHKSSRAHVLTAMGVTGDAAQNAIRISIGRDTTINDIDALTQAIKKLLM